MGMRYADDGNHYALLGYLRFDLMAEVMTSMAVSIFSSMPIIQCQPFNVNNVIGAELYGSSRVGLFYNSGPGKSYMLRLNYCDD